MAWFLLPLVVGGGGTAAGTGSGITLGSLLFWGSAVVAGIAVGTVVTIADDWLDTPTTDDETEGILTQVGDKSKADAQAVRDCANCAWCQILIHAQGTLVGGDGGSTMSLGPYFVNGRTVTTREGIVLLSATHAFLQENLGSRSFRGIEQLGTFARTAEYIRSRPANGGLPARNDWRPQRPRAESTMFRYDINVYGTINAFLE